MHKSVKVIGCSIVALIAIVAAFLVYFAVQYVRLSDPAAAAGAPVAATLADLAGAQDVTLVLEPIRRNFKLPALAAAAVKQDKTIALGAVGVRRAGGTERATVNDEFHIGSCTKAMTATLCAILVQQGKLKWDSTIGEVFADQVDKILPEYRDVTLDQLLTHRSGLPDDRAPDLTVWPKIRALSGPMLKQRREFVEIVLSQKPTAAPGAEFQYSNAGYTIAGAMCERVTGKTWEDLMREQLFVPLGMTTAGFGPPGTADKVDQPWGHVVLAIIWKSMPPGPFADNPAVIGPAGTVHCSLGDWAKFAAFHVRGDRGKEPTLPQEVFRRLHTPRPDDPEQYAYGWVVTNRSWAGGKALMHTGSNTMWMADIWLAPERDMAFVAATNVGTNMGFIGCDPAISELIKSASLLENSDRQGPAQP